MAKVYSFFRGLGGLKRVEVEVLLVSGVPSLQIVGRPEHFLRELGLKLKSAFLSSGFVWPQSQQIIVHLKPSFDRKVSEGLDLAVALGILHAQGHFSDIVGDIYAYGELGLNGEVSIPSDIDCIDPSDIPSALWTGSSNNPHFLFPTFQLPTLAQALAPTWSAPGQWEKLLEPPQPVTGERICSSAAEILMISALGNHHVLLAGPAGSGKTTMLKWLRSFVRKPERESFLKQRVVYRSKGLELGWRPWVEPHHLLPPRSIVGGGDPPQLGALALANAGTLSLDELLEFHPSVLEALREPLESGKVTLHRLHGLRTFECRIQLVSTTNLCPCGSWEPYQNVRCGLTLRRCRSYLDKLSGPLLDRFQLLIFTSSWRGANRNVDWETVSQTLCKAREFRDQEEAEFPGRSTHLETIEASLPKFDQQHMLPKAEDSLRRRKAILTVARTLADLDLSKKIERSHLKRSIELTYQSFLKIRSRNC